jgi:hypothetical protein
METQNPKTKLSFEQMPEALAYLIDEVAQLKKLSQMQVIAEPEKRRPIGVYQASKIIGKAVQTIYGLVCAKKIPFYKQGKQLYFFEDELLSYIESGRNGGK